MPMFLSCLVSLIRRIAFAFFVVKCFHQYIRLAYIYDKLRIVMLCVEDNCLDVNAIFDLMLKDWCRLLQKTVESITLGNVIV